MYKDSHPIILLTIAFVQEGSKMGAGVCILEKDTQDEVTLQPSMIFLNSRTKTMLQEQQLHPTLASIESDRLIG